MSIKPILPNIYTGKKLVPKSEYQGPILKLTKKEQATIKQLEEKVASLEVEQVQLINYIKKAKLSSTLEDIYSDKLDTLDYWIKGLRETIQNIKVARFNKQKAAFAKKNNTN